MNRLFWMIGIAIYVLGILILNPTSDFANAQLPTCTGAAQTNAAVDGQHSTPPGGFSTPGPPQQTSGSCSVSISSRAGQLTNGPPNHFDVQTAFSGPPSPPNTATCTSASAGPSGLTAAFADGSTTNGFCTQGVRSPPPP